MHLDLRSKYMRRIWCYTNETQKRIDRYTGEVVIDVIWGPQMEMMDIKMDAFHLHRNWNI